MSPVDQLYLAALEDLRADQVNALLRISEQKGQPLAELVVSAYLSHNMKPKNMKPKLILGCLICALALGACVQGGSVAMGHRYAPVAPVTVQILFQPPPWPYEQIGIVTCLGAQAASDAAVYQELQRQAAYLGADAVLVISSQPATQGGFATYNPWTGYGFAAGPSVIGLKLNGIAVKRIKS